MDTFVQLISPLMPQAQPVQQHDDDDNNNNNNTSTHAQEQTAKSVWKNVLFVFTHVDLSHAHGYYTVNSKYHARKIALKSKISRALKEKYSVTVDVPMLWISTKHETCASLKKDSASTGECDCELRCKYHSDARRRFYEQVWKRRNDPFIMAT
ncbi:hypothetical protein BDF20DRAFT_600470 [Mycotypha africana]|uniref:uncharacterized protein n=1 Tax=Mycotypha africana TaxID=64632 RepID=UPI002301AAAD|nr:uncharacterized protein BDF20DRAFT_600470 [Mycotypha africana]KAI8975340.1 hypothetical protein BDF20DRAFT_600470 [Mycotypha africana]